MPIFRFIIAALVLGALTACETIPEPPPPQQALNYRTGYGVVESVAIVDVPAPAPRRGVGVGTVAGGVVGAILGSQIGSGTGRAAATIGGAAGGAYLGHQLEQRRDRPATMAAYQLTLRMDDGVVQNIVQDNRAFQAGDRVQVTPDGRVIRTG